MAVAAIWVDKIWAVDLEVGNLEAVDLANSVAAEVVDLAKEAVMAVVVIIKPKKISRHNNNYKKINLDNNNNNNNKTNNNF